MRWLERLKNIVFFIFLMLVAYSLLNLIYRHFYFKSLELKVPHDVFTGQCQNETTKVYPKVKVAKILIISGGGVAGIIPLSFLQYLENQLHKPIVESFDVLSGTSTGGIIVAGLATPNELNKPKYSVQEILNHYIRFSENVMHTSPWRKIFTMNGFIGPLQDIRLLHKNVVSAIGNKVRIKDLLGHVYFTLFNLNRLKIDIFDNQSCKNGYQKYLVSDMLTAGSAASMAFSSVTFVDSETNAKKKYVDASIISMNSFPYVFNDVLQLFPNAKKFIIVFMGTGHYRIQDLKFREYNYDRWGALQWAAPLLKILYKDQFKFIHRDIENILAVAPQGLISYYYFNINQSFDVFDGSPENIKNITEAADAGVLAQQKELDKLVVELKANESTH
jgi:predicted acylesterase/phospholipase RssA